jgi:hypothetical protein
VRGLTEEERHALLCPLDERLPHALIDTLTKRGLLGQVACPAHGQGGRCSACNSEYFGRTTAGDRALRIDTAARAGVGVAA